jgi:RND family efflux transporter MFP subunit
VYHWLALAVLAGTVGCNRANPPAPAAGGNGAEAGPVKVKIVTPKRQALAWAIEQPGTVEPLEITPLVAKLPGYVKALAPDAVAAIRAGFKGQSGPAPLIDIGSDVYAGQLLATLDIPELDAEHAEKLAAVERAKAEKKQAEAERDVVTAQIAAADAAVKEADAGIARAEADINRWKAELDQASTQAASGIAEVQNRLVIAKNFESAKAARAEAEAKVATAKAQVQERTARRGRVEADVEAAEAKVKAARAEADRVAALLEYTRITAPFAGVVTARNVNTRTFTQSVGPQAPPVFTVAREDVLRVFADVPEASAEKASPGSPVVVRVPALGGREYPAAVTRTTRAVNPETRTLRTEIDIPNPDRALLPGAYVVVQIKAQTPDAVVIPGSCVLSADEAQFVFVVEGGKVVKYRVQLGRTDGTVYQVLGRRKATSTTGPWEKFTGTEQVVNGNLGALADGTPVAIE